MINTDTIQIRKKDGLQKVFLWLIVIDYFLLFFFIYRFNRLTLSGGVTISLMLFTYNSLLTFICFHRAKRHSDYYIIYPVLTATLLTFISFIYFFFLVA